MSLKKYIERIERMNWLISKKATGTPIEFARKMDISRSLLMEYLKFMKQLGGAIKYDTHAQSYIYLDDKEFYCGFSPKYSPSHQLANEEIMQYGLSPKAKSHRTYGNYFQNFSKSDHIGQS